MGKLPDYEKLASFYLGKRYELQAGQLLDEKVLYDAKDLTTHAMCVGMTGSGKTGLCLALLEEAALDGIPAICVDPKGDLGNLLLAFPDFDPADFQRWLEPADAARKGLGLDQFAEQTARQWRAGLESWDQDAERVRRYRDSVDIAIYTPGSSAGIPMTVLKRFDAPTPDVLGDRDILRERICGTASGLLTLMGITGDPLSSKEHILLSHIFEACWRKGQNLDLSTLIRLIQSPPIEKIGVFDMESFYPAAERMKLSITLNNLLASPAFSGWLAGQPLDINRLLYTAEGRPRMSIISIAHLTDPERMFFVTILLNEVLSWMRAQPGTSSLRAIFYMDEVSGYFPPVAQPPSKSPMLVLLKQARAFGLGIVLATQNPVDLDYKGLSNIGTWFLGRLQTQRDKDRVLEGLEGAAAQTGLPFERRAMEETLAALGKRIFLMNNVHASHPIIFQSRWAMSFLRGPLSRLQIQSLMDPRRQGLTPESVAPLTHSDSTSAFAVGQRPLVPPEMDERFWLPSRVPDPDAQLRYRPGLLASVSCHYVRSSAGLDDWCDRTLLYPFDHELQNDIWKDSLLITNELPDTSVEPEEGFHFAEVPAEMLNGKAYQRWTNDLRDHLYRHMPMTLYECEELRAFSKPGQGELSARVAWTQEVRERRDAEKDELRERYAKKVRMLEDKIRAAHQRLEREQAQYDQQKWSSLLNIGQTVLGAFLGHKISSRSATAGRSLGRAAQQRTDVIHAQETLAELQRDKLELEVECEREIHLLQEKYTVDSITLKPLQVPCRKGDLRIQSMQLVWIPWQIRPEGVAECLVDLPKPDSFHS